LINTFFTGIIMISLGLIAIYIARIHDEVMDRPLYIIERDTRRK
jgi:dolichol-phosphate mannosyltransferase